MNAHVSIAGASVLGAPGIGRNAVWEGMRTARLMPTVRSYELYDGSIIAFPVYEIPPIHMRDWLPRSTCRWLEQEGLHQDPDFLLLLVASQLAMEDAGLTPDERSRAALVIGHENPGINRLIDKILQTGQRIFQQDEQPLVSFSQYKQDFFRLQTFPYLFYLAKALNIQGASYITNNACASGLYALELGRQLIHQGQVESAVVVCADYAHATEYLWLGDKGFHSPKKVLKPFDSGRDGSVLGDGAAAVVLRHPDLVDVFTPELGRYVGGAFRQDGWNLSLPHVTSHSYAEVITRAVRLLGEGPPDLLVPHGTGMPMWDAYEMAEIVRAFGELNIPLPRMTALKGYFGHTLGANSLVEIVCLLHSMAQGSIPPAANYESHNFKLDIPMVTQWERSNIRTAIKTVSAFGGFLAAGVFEQST
ncbi:beta-ketoacyl synthase N-terminal-like domain-containing protein [Paenibacillus campinasensis]|uniref:Ketosynthase family 3 (KS3) domain-containing protein n=1 Tax=Paenibacillus campinasensis TaxID=66347 RepID=A0A268EYU2_9BACL|nr:beta-ketoacyl synthase N-terminal-like domain-containing protein [Paenibacillus campinasensis]PAD78287.1 hypothetical protein CHH67_07095 [Paenibacillus campinasensis]